MLDSISIRIISFVSCSSTWLICREKLIARVIEIKKLRDLVFRVILNK
jgi:hypothetical protein